MEKYNTQKIRLVFYPALLMSVFLTVCTILCHQAQNILLDTIKNVPAITILKGLGVFPQIILVSTLLIVSCFKSFEKVFRGTLYILIGTISFLSVLVFFQETLQLNEYFSHLINFLPDSTAQMFEPIIKNWPSSLLFISFNLLHFNLFSLLIWGFINRFTTPTEGIKYYIPLAFILGLVGALVTNLGQLFNGGANLSLIAVILPAIFLMIGVIVIFNYFWKRLPDDFFNSAQSNIKQTKNRFPFFAGAYLLAGLVMVEYLQNIFFKSEVRMQIPDPISYSNFMGNYSIAVGASTVIISIFWTILGTWIISKRSWRVTALYGSISVLIGGVVFFGFSLSNQTVSWLNQGVMIGLLKGTTTALFFPLVQILYLYMPEQVRFRTKVLTEMILLPLLKFIPSIALQGLVIVIGSMSAISIYGKIIIVILLILIVVASSNIGRKYHNLSEV